MSISLICVLLIYQVGAQATSIASADEAFLNKYQSKAVEQWEKEIVQLEKLDSLETDPDKAILFVGSSSIRRWD